MKAKMHAKSASLGRKTANMLTIVSLQSNINKSQYGARRLGQIKVRVDLSKHSHLLPRKMLVAMGGLRVESGKYKLV